MKTLVDRGDVLIVGGKGGQKDPYRYTTVEAFAAAAGFAFKDTASAKKQVAGLGAVAQDAMIKLCRVYAMSASCASG
jgi:hypothetical protein